MTTKAEARVTAQALRDEHLARVDEWCADHVAELQEDGRVLKFKRPGTGIYSTTFRIDGSFLVVYGDTGDAIYQWSCALNWEFLRGCGFGYFAGKCQAHPQGQFERSWDRDLMLAQAEEYFLEEGNEQPEAWGEFQDNLDEFSDRASWRHWLGEWGQDLIGDDWWDFAAAWGDFPDTTMMTHWRMLQLALGQVLGPRESAA